MSSRCSAGSVDSILPSMLPLALTLLGSARPTLIAGGSSSVTGPVSRCCPTCGSSTPELNGSTCCTAATPVSRSALLGNAREKPTPGTFGLSSRDSFAFYDPDLSCWRTCQGTLLSGSTGCSLTLPRWGTTVGGDAFELPTLVPPIGGSGCSSLPTPTGRDHKGRNQRDDTTCLPGAVALLPTPVAQDDQKSAAAHLQKKVASGAGETITSLTVMARQFVESGEWSNKLLPTPSANDHTGAEGPTREARQENGTGGPALRDVAHLLPTPMSSTYEQGGDGGELRAAITHGPTRRLLPTHRTNATRSSRRAMVENQQWSAPSLEQALEIAEGRLPREFESWDEVPGWSGAFTSPQSDDGKQSSDSSPPGQLTIGDA